MTHILSDEEFEKEILSYGYTSKKVKVFEEERLRDLFLPILKADLRITERYIRTKDIIPMECDISVLSMNDDPVIN